MKSSLLTVEEAAEQLNVSPSYVRRRLIFEKRIPYVKIGRHVRIEAQEIENLVEDGRVEPRDQKQTPKSAGPSLADIKREQLSRWRTSASIQ